MKYLIDSHDIHRYYLMKLFKDAGLPDGVINFVPGDPELVTNVCITHPDFAGIHYTGSTEVFR
jgi:1-pyrroline-5-carboxylate dehydrogenase